MSSGSIAETKNNLSAILASIANGSEEEHVIKNRNTPVAVIIPYAQGTRKTGHFGFAKGNGKKVDWEAFDAMDAEIAEEFGV